jgi:hypothetical protein
LYTAYVAGRISLAARSTAGRTISRARSSATSTKPGRSLAIAVVANWRMSRPVPRPAVSSRSLVCSAK